MMTKMMHRNAGRMTNAATKHMPMAANMTIVATMRTGLNMSLSWRPKPLRGVSGCAVGAEVNTAQPRRPLRRHLHEETGSDQRHNRADTEQHCGVSLCKQTWPPPSPQLTCERARQPDNEEDAAQQRDEEACSVACVGELRTHSFYPHPPNAYSRCMRDRPRSNWGFSCTVSARFRRR